MSEAFSQKSSDRWKIEGECYACGASDKTGQHGVETGGKKSVFSTLWAFPAISGSSEKARATTGDDSRREKSGWAAFELVR
jgi:hypothetical protein